MKRWIHASTEYVEAGVRKTSEGYKIDYTYNYPEDIIDIVEPQLYESAHDNNIYRFGYRFNDEASSKDRTEFIHSIKQIGEQPLEDYELDQFIKRPLKYLNQVINLQQIDCLVYPLSQRSPLVKKMIRCINDMTSHDMEGASFELVKQAPERIGFDFKSFKRDHEDEQGYNQMLNYINAILIPKLQALDYLSIARDVKHKYRPYITGFLDFKDQESIDELAALQGANILVVDDINTSGSTLNEILRKLTTINNNSNIFVYTLIGK